MERTTEMEQFLLKQRRRKKGDFWRLGVNSGHFKFIFQTAGVRVPKLRYLRRKGGGLSPSRTKYTRSTTRVLAEMSQHKGHVLPFFFSPLRP